MRPDLERARVAAKSILTFTVILPIVLLFLWVAGPGSMGGGLSGPWYAEAMPWVGVGLYLVGLGWMVRIYRSRLPTSKAEWRYRS